jgi:hypothetical protein
MSTEKDKVYLPVSTEELLQFLPRLYDARELVALTLQGKTEEATKLAAKIEFIDELADIWQEQKEEAVKNAALP